MWKIRPLQKKINLVTATGKTTGVQGKTSLEMSHRKPMLWMTQLLDWIFKHTGTMLNMKIGKGVAAGKCDFAS